MDRAHTCCFTGHRPEKLPWREDESDPRCLALKARLRRELEEAYRQGFRHFDLRDGPGGGSLFL